MRLYRSMRLRNKCAFWFRCTVPGQKAEPSRKRTEKWLGYHLPNRTGSIVVLAGRWLILQLIEFRCVRNRIQAANRYQRNIKSERHPKPPWTRITVFRTSAGAESDLSFFRLWYPTGDVLFSFASFRVDHLPNRTGESDSMLAWKIAAFSFVK